MNCTLNLTWPCTILKIFILTKHCICLNKCWRKPHEIFHDVYLLLSYKWICIAVLSIFFRPQIFKSSPKGVLVSIFDEKETKRRPTVTKYDLTDGPRIINDKHPVQYNTPYTTHNYINLGLLTGIGSWQGCAAEEFDVPPFYTGVLASKWHPFVRNLECTTLMYGATDI